MKLLVGLGNPGLKYQNNRHNIGQMMIDYIVDQVQSSKFKVQNDSSKFKIIKTSCYMNQSGRFVKQLISQYPNFSISDLVIVHDDLDIPLGKFKIQQGTGPQLHNGIESIEKTLNTKDFWRVRIGVDNRLKNGYVDGETYVLQDFQPEEKKIINDIFRIIYQRLKLQLPQ